MTLQQSFDCDVVILIHKRNNVRNSYFHFGTEGRAATFLDLYKEVNSLWRAYTSKPLHAQLPSATGKINIKICTKLAYVVNLHCRYMD